METKRIKITVATKKTADGREFNTYKATTKNGRLIDVKFRKEVKNLPEKTCYAIINVDDMNVVRNTEFPVMWVKAVQGYESLDDVSTEQNRKVINDMFD